MSRLPLAALALLAPLASAAPGPDAAAGVAGPGGAPPAGPRFPADAKGLRVPWDAGGRPGDIRSLAAAGDTRITHYAYDLRIDPVERTLEGVATLEVTRAAGDDTITLDLVDLDVASVAVDGDDVGFEQDEESVEIPLPGDGEVVEVRIGYGGEPTLTADGRGLIFGSGTVFSFVEPDGARRWLPLIDLPDRKAPLRLSVTMPESFVIVSNGLEESDVPADDGWHTVTWATVFPIAPYLISVAAARYELVEDEWEGMFVGYWAPPHSIDAAAADFARTPEMLTVFSDLFFPYPFEKYGTALAPMGGAMEHQTATTFGSSLVDGSGWAEWIVAHELAHQWWGDWVTCATWDDIWLNEGFASFGEALWTEADSGEEGYREYLAWQAESYMAWTDYEGVFPLAAPDYMWGGTVYDKGSYVLSMLRGELGDEGFFDALRAWADAYPMAAGTTAQFQAVVEASAGRDLGVFFDQWIYGPGHPVLERAWRATPLVDGNWQLDLRLVQVQDVETVFQVPVEVSVSLEGGGVHAATAGVGKAEQEFAFCLGPEPSSLDLDPSGKLLHESFSVGFPETPFVPACGADAAGDPIGDDDTAADDDSAPDDDAAPDDDDAADDDDAGPPGGEAPDIEFGPAGCSCDSSDAPATGGSAGLLAALVALRGLSRRRSG